MSSRRPGAKSLRACGVLAYPPRSPVGQACVSPVCWEPISRTPCATRQHFALASDTWDQAYFGLLIQLHGRVDGNEFGIGLPTCSEIGIGDGDFGATVQEQVLPGLQAIAAISRCIGEIGIGLSVHGQDGVFIIRHIWILGLQLLVNRLQDLVPIGFAAWGFRERGVRSPIYSKDMLFFVGIPGEAMSTSQAQT